MNLIQTNIGRDIFETVRTEITKEPDFTLAIGSFTYGDQVNPAVVVVIEGRYAPAANPVRSGKSNGIEALSLMVTPERHSWCG